MSADGDSPQTLALILPDDLNASSRLFAELDPESDLVWMAEDGVGTAFLPGGPPAHKRKVAYMLSAMRHFRDEIRDRGFVLRYRALGEAEDPGSDDPFTRTFQADLRALRPGRVLVTRPGDHGMLERLRGACSAAGVELAVLEDEHFITTPADFAEFMDGRKSPLLESFYRRVRRREGVLMSADGGPEGGAWNYDTENRETFGRDGPTDVPEQPRFPHDEISRHVVSLVAARFPDNPGTDAAFDLPVTGSEAEEALRDFVTRRLPRFGDVQDAMWTGRHFLYHSRLSAPLNLKLLDPRRAVSAAEAAYRSGSAPLNAVEGFIRQILGWREFVRGVYFYYGPEYAERNGLDATADLPPLYWTGETDMRCLSETMGAILSHGYAHHIQRLMVAGLFAMLYGARPDEFNAWHMAMYVDAFDWVSVPNTVGMSLHADGGTVGTKPYAATGKYINRMSNYCRHCPFDPNTASGPDACPFTTLYWTFLETHADRFRGNRRMTFQLKNLDRKDAAEMERIRTREAEIRKRAAAGTL